MKKRASLFAITTFLASTFAWAGEERSRDLRYCLELRSNYDIAVCAGEISAGRKGRIFSKEKVKRKLSEEELCPPSSTNDMPSSAATGSGNP